MNSKYPVSTGTLHWLTAGLIAVQMTLGFLAALNEHIFGDIHENLLKRII